MDVQTVYLTRLFKSGNSFAVLIPLEIVRGYGWERGDNLIFGFAPNDQLWLRRLTAQELQQLKPPIIKHD